MTQKGKHTWDLHVRYHSCPSCSYILQSQRKYEYRMGKYEKDLECPRCGKSWTEEKSVKPKFGPLWDQEWKLFG